MAASPAPTIFTWGGFPFQVYPVAMTEYDHITGTSYAKKDVVQAVPQREWVGEEDEDIQLRGRVHPHFFAYYDAFQLLELFDARRRQGVAHQLIRGAAQGDIMGWFVVERLLRRHTSIWTDGVGQVIDFDALFARCDTPDPANYYFDVTSTDFNVVGNKA